MKAMTLDRPHAGLNAERRVIESACEIDTPTGPMPVLLLRPAETGPFPVVILIPHIGGVSRLMKAMARRLAAGGYLCAVPDLYHRLGRIVVDPIDKTPAVAAIRKIAFESLTPEGISEDIGALLRGLEAESMARPGPRGVMATGRTAALAVQAVVDHPQAIAAFVAVLGIGFVTDHPDSPHRLFDRLDAEIYLGFSATDEFVPPAVIAEIEAALRKSGADHRIMVHPVDGHAYFIPERAAYTPEAAEADWRATFDVFDRRVAKSHAPQRETGRT